MQMVFLQCCDLVCDLCLPIVVITQKYTVMCNLVLRMYLKEMWIKGESAAHEIGIQELMPGEPVALLGAHTWYGLQNLTF